MNVGIIDYGVGNLGSVVRALEELRVSPTLVNRAVDLHHCDCMILPGVGNFTDCMRLLDINGWSASIKEEVIAYNKPLLGVCLGMQLLASCGFEGADDPIFGTPGLGFVPGRVEHLTRLGCRLRVPHVGWNNIVATSAGCQLFNGIPDETDFYFVHSYGFVPLDQQDILATTEYDIDIVAAIQRGRVWGTQFHPEKSSRAGFQLLRNFITGPAC
jgi:glutamine amidotransferase